MKYPSTPYLPWSPEVAFDGFFLSENHGMLGKEVVVTEKMDGENTSLYHDRVHARSIDSRSHPSRTHVKQLQARIGFELPENLRFCGENLYAQHSIRYENLENYFYLFSVWEGERCLSWQDTEEWAALLELPLPRLLYRGVWDEKKLRSLNVDTSLSEGYVVRTADSFPYSAFADHVAKWVRPNHVQTSRHWMSQPVVPNGLRSSQWPPANRSELE